MWQKQTSNACVSTFSKTVVSIKSLCVDNVEASGFVGTSLESIATTWKSSGGFSSRLPRYSSAECGWYSCSGSTDCRGTISSASAVSPNGYAALYSLAAQKKIHCMISEVQTHQIKMSRFSDRREGMAGWRTADDVWGRNWMHARRRRTINTVLESYLSMLINRRGQIHVLSLWQKT